MRVLDLDGVCSKVRFDRVDDDRTTMLAFKKQKTDFMWRRLQKSSPAFKPLTVKEKSDMVLLKMMMDMNRDDPAVAASMTEMDSLYTSMIRGHGERNVRYGQVTLGGDAKQLGYEGATEVGRAFTSSVLPRFKRRITNTLFKQTHVEIDIKCSYPTMLAKAFEGAGLTALKVYADDPNGVYDGFAKEGVRRELVKEMVLKTVCSYPRKLPSFGVDFSEVEACRVFDGHKFVEGLWEDLGKMSAYMKEHYGPFFSMVVAHGVAKGKAGDTSDGVAFSYIAQDMEHSVMRCVIDKLYGSEPEDMVWLFDGILARHAVMEGKPNDEFCADLSRCVKEKLGLDVKFGIKDLHGNSLPISIGNQEMRELSGYGAWKAGFEKRWFRLTNPPVYCMILPDGTVLDHNDTQFKHNTMEENQDMIKTWKADPHKRMFVCKDFAPPPVVKISNSYNTWPGFAAEKLPEAEEGYDLGPYLRHVKMLMGNKDEYADYFNKLMALKFQFPGSGWRVMPFIRSTPGVGKDVWFDFISRIMGSALTCKLTRVGDLMDKSSHLMESKLAICFSEAEFSDSSRHMDALKDAITSDKLTVKKKYVNEYVIRSCAVFIAFSNNFGAFNVPVDDRRFFCVTADGSFANNPDYHRPLIEYLDKEETAAAVFKYYMELDVSDFDPSGERPVTETFKEMATSTLSLFDIMLKKGFHIWLANARCCPADGLRVENENVLRVPVKIIWQDFQQVALDAKVNKADSMNAMSQFGTRLMSESAERIQRFKSIDSWDKAIQDYKSHGKRFKKFDIMAVQRYITEMLGGEDDDEEAMLIPPQV